MRADLSDVKLSVLSEIGAEAVRIYGAKSVVVAIYNSSPEIFRSNTIETIQQDLFKRRAWMKLKTFALEHLDHLSELFDAEDFYQAITAYVPLLWGVDNGATLREVFEAYKSATEFQSVL